MTTDPTEEAVERGRDARQEAVRDWCEAAFGVEQASSIPQRGLRLLEEAVEAFQAAGGDPVQGRMLINYVFSRPVGTLAQELGGVGVTALALAAAAHLSADGCERAEVRRVLAKPIEHFAARNQAKNDAGFLALSPPPATPSEGAGDAVERLFPIIPVRSYDRSSKTKSWGGKSIPWSIAEKAYAEYARQYGHGQSLELLAQRGGFHVDEMDHLYPPWRDETDELLALKRRVAELEAALSAMPTGANNKETGNG